ncbi:hypothetical protein OW715_14520 [Acidithiobacillus ferriphilus]|nr:hypothetical protein [Acidithiobacillus ferriphilus]
MLLTFHLSRFSLLPIAIAKIRRPVSLTLRDLVAHSLLPVLLTLLQGLPFPVCMLLQRLLVHFLRALLYFAQIFLRFFVLRLAFSRLRGLVFSPFLLRYRLRFHGLSLHFAGIVAGDDVGAFDQDFGELVDFLVVKICD